MRLISLLFSFQVLSTSLFGQRLEAITPKPVAVQKLAQPGVVIKEGYKLSCDPRYSRQANYLAEQISNQCGIGVGRIAESDRTGDIILENDLSIKHDEGYQLTVQDNKVNLKARTARGIVNGIQTLIQLLPLQPTAKIEIAACVINDQPRFSYRGMHLDVARHFFPVAYIKKYIDYLAFHKFNSFHWHLTDDQGWRIEVLSYPKLNSIGSWRDSTLIGHFRESPPRYERKRYGGYYTRDEIRDIIDYASVRAITVIPEIDIPGHSRATITAYPEFSTDPRASWGVAATWGMYSRQNNVLAPNPATFTFLKKIFHEIADLFPSEYIHIGGDECSKLWWKQSESTQAFMKQKGLKDEAALQTYFIEQVSAYLKEKKKKVIGWHEIMEGKLDTSTIVMNWSNDAKAMEALSKGYSVIMTPGSPYYFDNYQSKDPKDSLAIHGYNPLGAVYKYDPVPATAKQKGLAGKILGGQGNVWTEYMEYPSKVDYMIFPRMTALSESLWTAADKKDYKDFTRRLKENIIPRYRYWNSSWFGDFEKWKAN